ncbi:hypothetical protein D9M70_489310 [compost metagenome]
MGGLAEIVVGLQQNARAGGNAIEPRSQIGDVFAARVDDQVGPKRRIVDRIHVGRDRTEFLREGIIQGSRNRFHVRVDVEAVDRSHVEARILQQHRAQDAIPTAEDRNPGVG